MDNIREDIQRDAMQAWFDAGGVGTLALGTGVGKSKVAIDIAVKLTRGMELATFGSEQLRILLVTPTIILHEQNWKAEFEKFDAIDVYNKLDRACYVSLPNYDPDDYDMVIFDEYHHISERGFEDFSSKINTSKTKILGLTATPPKKGDRKTRFDEVCPVVFEYTIEEAAGVVVNDFRIHVVRIPLDAVTKNVKGGSRLKPFMTTEQRTYEYYSGVVDKTKQEIKDARVNPGIDDYLWMPDEVELARLQKKLQVQALTRKRMLDTFPSRVRYAKIIIEKELAGYKSIIFAPSIEQAESVCKNTFHSKVDGNRMKDFIAGLLDQIATVNMADEGLTMGKIERALIMKLQSTDKTFLQRIGRVCRNDLDKLSHIYVLVYAGTIEDDYLEEALSSINPEKVDYKTIHYYDRPKFAGN